MKGINNTTTASFEEIIGSRKKFIIPKFQRDYSWDTDQWDDLWQDIVKAKNEKDEHYMGYLVLQNDSSEKTNFIIDGQQRFTTITFIILAAIKSIKFLVEKGIEVDDNNQRIKNLTERYIGNQNPISLTYDNILQLNRNNNSYYRDYIVKLEHLKNRGTLLSEKKMKKCFEFYENKLKSKFSTGADYAEFITFVVDNLFFTVITVSDEMNAFKVFETLNARGVQLSASDLLKNYLFSLVDKNDCHKSIIADLEDKWIKLTANVKEKNLPDFIRYYWNSKNKTIRANELFKEIRKSITKDTEVFRLLDDMIFYSDIYMALQNSNDEFWNNDEEIKRNIDLLNTFKIRQAFPLLMSAYKHLDLNKFKQVLSHIVIISFRFNVICGKNPNEIEVVYNKIARAITNEQLYKKEYLSEIYVSDNEFAGSFNNISFEENARNNKIVKYILDEIDHHNGEIRCDRQDESVTIEHVIPQNDDSDEFREYIYRLGNMFLLEKKLNRDCSTKSFNEKKEIYLKSSFNTIKKIAEDYEAWDDKKIEYRQSQMSKVAKGIWKIQNL